MHDKVHKKIIHVDDQLGRFIPVDHVTMFELAKYVNKQLLSDTSVDLEALNNNTKKKGSKKRVRDEIVETQEVVEREKPREFMDFSSRRQFNPLYLPSPELAAFLKVDEPVTRPFVIKKI